MGTSKGKAAADRPEDGVRTDPPGPVDHGRNGGMATRENAPEVADGSSRDGD